MSESPTPSTSHPPEFLTTTLRLNSTEPDNKNRTRPHVTLTFAQSLDGKIAGKGGKQLILSGKESMIMTHWMRTMHDAILVGIGTALNDDPQLNTRHLPPRLPTEERYNLPRPIILDSYLRLPPTCKLLKNFQNGTGRRPWVVCSSSTMSPISPVESSRRRKELENAGARIIELDEDSGTGKISLPFLLAKLYSLDIHSLMIEGGASIIGAFLSEASSSDCSVVDTVIITVAPIFVGADGIGYGARLGKEHIPKLQHIQTEVMGQDTVVAAILVP